MLGDGFPLSTKGDLDHLFRVGGTKRGMGGGVVY